MRFCHVCGLSMGEKATFCATCGALVPADVAPVTREPAAVLAEPAADPAPAAATAQPRECRLCRREVPTVDARGVCAACRAEIALFVPAKPGEPLAVTLATSEAAAGPECLTIAGAIYSALGDDGTCPACRALDGRETTDVAAAAGWAPNPHCGNPQGCRCLVFFEHESLAPDEEGEFVEYAAGRGLRATAAAVAAFHEDKRASQEEMDGLLQDATALLRTARALEKSDPQDAVALYRGVIEALTEWCDSPLEERRVRRDLPVAFNRLTLVLQGLGQTAEALDEIERAASWGIPERDDCGRKADRAALRNRGRRLRERAKAPVPA